MTANQESLYWKTNKEWFFINDEGKFELAPNVPERVKKSFELFTSKETGKHHKN